MKYSIIIEQIALPKKLIIYGASIHGRVLKEEESGSSFSLESRDHKILLNGDFYFTVKSSEKIPDSEAIQMASIKTSHGVIRIGTKTYFEKRKAFVIAPHGNIKYGGNLQEHINYLKREEKQKKKKENRNVLIALIIVFIVIMLIVVNTLQ